MSYCNPLSFGRLIQNTKKTDYSENELRPY
jgi:hypothetical protein